MEKNGKKCNSTRAVPPWRRQAQKSKRQHWPPRHQRRGVVTVQQHSWGAEDTNRSTGYRKRKKPPSGTHPRKTPAAKPKTCFPRMFGNIASQAGSQASVRLPAATARLPAVKLAGRPCKQTALKTTTPRGSAGPKRQPAIPPWSPGSQHPGQQGSAQRPQS
ncbi:hypothetical protein NDU88_004406 [Pleurodeles waltl]|uniref:Uncharacterized protein n=1 Tax=Pleurodeles waltl TaxID=8319 RepID=A0AAV7MV21_PLEWA|nr:hypothetical protein NDU88_004406 [Pleurodeles waltl]